MKHLPIVALIGQTNAGKSSLLNRFARKNIAIVAREEGTTRDNVSARIDDSYLCIDTAGLKDPTDDFERSIQSQIEDAIDSADLILLTLDSTKYPDDRDKMIAKKALKSRKPVFLVLNKSDLSGSLDDTDFLRLGVKTENTFRTSATTGQGISSLKSAIFSTLRDVGLAFSNVSLGDFLSEPHKTAERNCQAGEHYVLEGTFGGHDRERSGRSPVTTGAKDHVSRWDIMSPETTEQNTSPEAAESQKSITLALIGRPNVGKSSLFNSLGKKQQALVSSRQGTTRDVNRVEIRYKGQNIEILDTAGLRKPGRREVGIEKFSAIRTLAAIEESDICALLIDATEPHSKLDQSLAGEIVKAGKGIIVVLTKTDLKTHEEVEKILDDLERDFNFIPFAPVLLTSSETGANVTQLFQLATEIMENRKIKIKTADLNKILNDCILEHRPAGLKNTHPKPKYIVQTDSCPPWFVVHGHDLGLLHWSWKRFLENKLRETYPFVGTPIFFSFHSGDKD